MATKGAFQGGLRKSAEGSDRTSRSGETGGPRLSDLAMLIHPFLFFKIPVDIITDFSASLPDTCCSMFAWTAVNKLCCFNYLCKILSCERFSWISPSTKFF